MTSSLVLHLPLNEGSGTKVFDRSQNKNHGTVAGGASWVAGRLNQKALSFDGIDARINIPYNVVLNPTSAITLEVWIYHQEVTSGIYNTVLKKDSAHCFDFYDGNLLFQLTNSIPTTRTLSISETPYLNQWTHYVGTWDGNGDKLMRFYVNGKLVSIDSVALDSPLKTNANDTWIGYYSGLDRYFNGIIGKARIYSRALSASEIRSIYQKEAFDLDYGLVLHLPLNEGSGTKVKDLSSYQNHGTISGAAFARPYENDTTDEGVSPLIITDDNQVAFWTEGDGYTIVNDAVNKVKGVDCLAYTDNIGAGGAWIYHRYTAVGYQDWSKYDLYSFWMYGTNTGNSFAVYIHTKSFTDALNTYSYSLANNFTGWRRIIITLRSMTPVGTPDLSQVGWIQLFSSSAADPTGLKFDRFIIDIGNWRFGKAINFDGINDKVDLGDVLDMDISDFTITAWVKTSTVPEGIIWKAASWASVGYGIIIETGGYLRGYICDASGYTYSTADGVPINDDLWHFIAVVWDRDTKMIRYVDGIQTGTQDSVSSRSLTINNAVTLKIGCRDDALYFKGIISNVCVHNRVLSAEEVRCLYKRTIP